MATAGFGEHHTAQNISKRLVEITNDVGITGKIVTLTHDEAANQCAAIRKACAATTEKSTDGSWRSVVCIAHRLPTSSKHALQVNEVTHLLSNCRKLVGHFCYSAKATQALKENQMEWPPTKVIQDIMTRWNSTYYMLECLTVLHPAISSVLCHKSVSKASDANLDLSTKEWRIADSLVKLLQPFELATRLLSVEQYVSISCAIPVMKGLNRSLTAEDEDDDCQAIQTVKYILQDELSKRFHLECLDADALEVVASLLDPRFKRAEFFPDLDDKKAAHSALLAMMKGETR